MPPLTFFSPGNLPISRMPTVTPFRARWRAQADPDGPAPTTRTSNSRCNPALYRSELGEGRNRLPNRLSPGHEGLSLLIGELQFVDLLRAGLPQLDWDTDADPPLAVLPFEHRRCGKDILPVPYNRLGHSRDRVSRGIDGRPLFCDYVCRHLPRLLDGLTDLSFAEQGGERAPADRGVARDRNHVFAVLSDD